LLDIRLIREHPEVVRADLEKRGAADRLRMLEELIECDREWRRLRAEVDELRRRRNAITGEITRLKREGRDVSGLLREAKALPEKIRGLEGRMGEYRGKVDYCLLRIPNILHESVPVGKGEDDNVPVRSWGRKPEFDFPPKDHVELGVSLGLIDVERAAKTSGARFYYLKNGAVMLDMALMNFALTEMKRKGFVPVEPPFMMRRRPYEGATDLGDFEEMLYKVEEEDLYLIATSEHPIAAMLMDEVLNAELLPLRYVGVSANFRREAGAHGKDTKGIFRAHQFNKVEQFIFCRPEESWGLHEELIRNAEELFQGLELPYRVVNVCTGDIATFAAKKYDLEVWMPAQGRYREVVSCSNCTDYQARRLNIRYREAEGKPPKGFVHTLNSTAIATGRAIVAILENYQQGDGSVIVPSVLRPFMGGIERIERKE